MARHCERVTATDVSPRALAFAAFNAQLNGVENIELVHGSWFEPVARRTFDLVVANPPYVVSPDAAFTYRDGNLERDEVARTVVEGAAAHLRDGRLRDGRVQLDPRRRGRLARAARIHGSPAAAATPCCCATTATTR